MNRILSPRDYITLLISQVPSTQTLTLVNGLPDPWNIPTPVFLIPLYIPLSEAVCLTRSTRNIT